MANRLEGGATHARGRDHRRRAHGKPFAAVRNISSVLLFCCVSWRRAPAPWCCCARARRACNDHSWRRLLRYRRKKEEEDVPPYMSCALREGAVAALRTARAPAGWTAVVVSISKGAEAPPDGFSREGRRRLPLLAAAYADLHLVAAGQRCKGARWM